MIVSHHTLKLLAAIVWYSGPLILFTKGAQLAVGAQELEPESMGKAISWAGGILLGIIKTRFLFIKSNRKNLARIDALETPRIWDFYRLRFFFSLSMMMLLGRYLSISSQGHYSYMVFVAILDISIGTALLLSSIEFWKPMHLPLRKSATAL